MACLRRSLSVAAARAVAQSQGSAPARLPPLPPSQSLVVTSHTGIWHDCWFVPRTVPIEEAQKHGQAQRLQRQSPKPEVPLLSRTLRQFLKAVHPDTFPEGLASPQIRLSNSRNLANLNNFLTSIRKAGNSDEDPWPPAQVHTFTFYVRTDALPQASQRPQPQPAQQQPAWNNVAPGRGRKTTYGAPKAANYGPSKPAAHATTAAATPVQQQQQAKGGLRKLQFTVRTTGGDCKRLVQEQLGEFFAGIGLPRQFVWDPDFWPSKPPQPHSRLEDSDFDDMEPEDYTY